RFACTADLIPAVLGGPSQPLDVGRRERLATKAIRAAVILRDGGCTFPGCDRPPGFCEVHHVTPWWAGGDTSLADSALLCGRHHQTVHRQGYTAQVLPGRVEWDLTPGRMPGHHNTAA
ncbi:MAG TPA: HNH endonuclease signature motif containing protein, partial [Flexivirga sp.]|uniref:HNH endonuclease signature motif containing protein n=1 Tax=Flexivirga sp. TaxID=1962927 RepID=UPI002C9FCDE1